MKPTRRSRKAPQPHSHSRERKVYRPSASLRRTTIVVILVLGAAAIGFAYVSTRSLLSTAFCALPIGLFFVLVVTYLSYLARRTSLVLAPHGLEYHTPNLTLRTTWENVAQIIEDPITPRLVLRQPAPVEQRRSLAPDRAGGQAIAGKAIPLRLFGYSRRSALGLDLQHYAPYLFTTPERSPSR